MTDETITLRGGWSARTGYVLAALGVVLVTIAVRPLQAAVEPVNLVMLYLLLVVGIAVQCGRGPAAFCALLCGLAYDYVFMPRQMAFAVGNLQYVLTFAVLLLVGLLLAHMTARMRYQAERATLRENAARSLYLLARDLAGCIEAGRVCQLLEAFLAQAAQAELELWWEDSTHALGRLPSLRSTPLLAAAEGGIPAPVQTVLEQGQVLQLDAGPGASAQVLLFPLEAPMRRRGVMVVRLPAARLSDWLRAELLSVAVLAATTLERLHYVSVAQSVTVDMERERLRATILAALSHDIRTPLTVIVGLVDTLGEACQPMSERLRELVANIRTQALGMSGLTNNLLDLARVQSGKLQLRLEWQSVEEIVGAAIAHTQARLAEHQVLVDLPADLPLVEFDAVLMERVLCNLLENAARYCPRGSQIRLGAELDAASLILVVSDNGPGLPPHMGEQLFEPFVRGPAARYGGLGLGLSICRSIVAAHQGQISADSPGQGGARFTIVLPRREPPRIEFEEGRGQ